MNAKTIDDALNAISQLQGYGLLAYELIESTIRDGAHEDADAAALAIHEAMRNACDELRHIINDESQMNSATA